MLWDVLKTFARFFVVFFLLIVAFATTFYALFKNQVIYPDQTKCIQTKVYSNSKVYFQLKYTLKKNVILLKCISFKKVIFSQPAFSSLPKSIVKTLVMMVGEYDFVNLFHPPQESFKTTIFYNDLSIIFFSLFVIVMTILIMNLLVTKFYPFLKTTLIISYLICRLV